MAETPRATPGYEQIVYASQPRQTEAPFGFGIGLLAGAAAGMAAGDLIYDCLAKLDQSLCQYSSIPITWPMTKMLMTTVLHMADQHVFPAAGWEYFPIVAAGIAGTAGGIAGAVAFWKKGTRHVEGGKLVPAYKIPKMNRGATPGVWINKHVRLSRRSETRGIVTIGAPGTGKTTMMMPIVDQAINGIHGDRVFIVDFKRDYKKRFFGQNGVKFIGPWDPDSCLWQLGADLLSPSDASAFADALIPEGDGQDIWPAAARGVVTGVVMHLQTTRNKAWGWVELGEELRILLKDTAAMAAAIAEHKPLVSDRLEFMPPETRESVYFSITTYGETIISIGRIEANLKSGEWWSVSEWLTSENKVAIVGWNPEEEELSARIALPIFKMVIQRLLSYPDIGADEPGYWCFIDECGQLGTIPGFVESFTAGRSKGIRMSIGFQTFAQLLKSYQDEKRSLVGAETRILGQLLDPDDQADAQAVCGMAVVERLTVTTQVNGGRSESWPRTEEPIYRASKFGTLGEAAGGAKMLYVGRGVVSELFFTHLKKV